MGRTLTAGEAEASVAIGRVWRAYILHLVRISLSQVG